MVKPTVALAALLAMFAAMPAAEAKRVRKTGNTDSIKRQLQHKAPKEDATAALSKEDRELFINGPDLGNTCDAVLSSLEPVLEKLAYAANNANIDGVWGGPPVAEVWTVWGGPPLYVEGEYYNYGAAFQYGCGNPTTVWSAWSAWSGVGIEEPIAEGIEEVSMSLP